MNGFTEEFIYYICEEKDNQIHSAICPTNQIVFTIEEFLEKFPYKVGDKVQHKGATSCGTVYVIERINWANTNIEYEIRPLYDYNHTGLVTVCAEDLQPYKEETMDKAVFDANAQCCDIMNHLIKKETMEENLTIQDIRDNNAEWLLNKLEGMSAKKALQTISDLYDKLRKPKYPKTYEECCKVLFPNSIALGKVLTSGYNCELLKKLGELLICRDAYWKIAGEQMGLGKPWEPNWLNKEQDKFVLYTHNNVICSNRFVFGHNVFAFPTEEMRDEFYENFKKLIEQCKELL